MRRATKARPASRTAVSKGGVTRPAAMKAPGDSVEGAHLWVVPHTHWDREWYLSLEEFRLHLVELLDRVLEALRASPDFRFSLDGQAVVVEDYLQVRPEAASELAEHLRSGRLAAGPCHVLADHQQVSAELLIRNLLLGRAAVARLGGAPSRLLYSPDSFGHCAQIPQILASFGMRTFVFSRGMGNAPAEPRLHLAWEGPDGAIVRAEALLMDLFGRDGQWIAGAYSNGRLLPEGREDLAGRVRDLVAAQARLGDGRHVLVLNGYDHSPLDEGIGEKVRVMASLPGVASARFATLDMWEEQVSREGPSLAARQKVSGRLNDSRYFRVLPHVGSTGVRAKQEYLRVLREFEGAYDPWLAWAALRGDRFGAPFMANAWRLLVQNATHDSVCLCSCDRVYRAFRDRTERARLEGARAARRALQRVHQADPRRLEPLGACDEAVLLWNPLPRERAATVEASFFTAAESPRWVARAAGGEAFPCEALAVHTTARLLAAFAPAEAMGETRREVSVLVGPVRLPACGWKLLTFAPAARAAPVAHGNHELPATWLAERAPDEGDTYETRLRAGMRERAEFPTGRGVAGVAALALGGSSFELRPRSARDHMGEVRLQGVTLALSSEEENVRLRVGVRLPARISAAWGLAPAYWQPMDARLPSDAGWVAPKASEEIFLGAVCAETASGAWAVAFPDLLEWEWDRESGDTLWVTLRRSVSRLGRPGTGPELRLHEVREPGKTVAEGALIFSPEGSMEAVRRAAEAARFPPVVLPVGEGMRALDGKSLLSLEGEGLSLSIVKAAEDGRGIVVRVWNTSVSPRSGRLLLGMAPVSAWRSGMDERRDEPISAGGGAIPLALAPCRIETLRVEAPAVSDARPKTE